MSLVVEKTRPTAPVRNGHREMIIVTTGELLRWETEDKEAEAEVRRRFNKLISSNFAFSVKTEVEGRIVDGEVVRDFPEDAPKIIMTPQISGG